MLLTPISGDTILSSGGAVLSCKKGDKSVLNVEITGGTATVYLYARLDSSMSWIQMGSAITASGIIEHPWAHEWAYRVSSISGATVKVALLESGLSSRTTPAISDLTWWPESARWGADFINNRYMVNNAPAGISDLFTLGDPENSLSSSGLTVTYPDNFRLTAPGGLSEFTVHADINVPAWGDTFPPLVAFADGTSGNITWNGLQSSNTTYIQSWDGTGNAFIGNSDPNTLTPPSDQWVYITYDESTGLIQLKREGQTLVSGNNNSDATGLTRLLFGYSSQAGNTPYTVRGLIGWDSVIPESAMTGYIFREAP